MRTFTLLILSVFLLLFHATPVFAVKQATEQAAEFSLNKGSGMQKYQLGTLLVRDKVWVLKGVYDFAKQGGATGTINLKNIYSNTLYLPKGAVIKDCYLDVITAPTSAGSATIAISSGKAANDLKSAAQSSGFSGIMACVPVSTAATAIKLTADVTPVIVIGTAALTAGKINVIIEYYLSDTE